MAIEPIPLHPLERGYLRVLRIRSVFLWLTLSAIAAAADMDLPAADMVETVDHVFAVEATGDCCVHPTEEPNP
jgi:hypothetical protein